MDLDEQIRDLVDNAPQDGTTPALVEAIAPVLKQVAMQLRHLEYYVVQTLDRSWAVTVLSHHSQPDTQKQVIYAYPTLKDVSLGSTSVKDPQMIALPIPVIHILFQMAAMDTVDSVIFFEVPGNLIAGTEIRRMDLQTMVQTQLHHRTNPSQSTLPPDIA